MTSVNSDQGRFAALPLGNILLIAPAGCGKTEALAARARAILQNGELTAPQRILTLTFSNKARDNLAARMRGIVGAGWRQRITASNFHGLAARVIKAHGNVVGIPQDVILPEDPWRRRQLRDLGVDGYTDNGPFEEALRLAKLGRFDDAEVMERLSASGHSAAIEFECRLRAENRLDYDDLIRHAGRLLDLPAVRRLYQAHFGMVMVDEVQDLSLLQYEIVRALGADRVAYAGDPAQGIYSFAGADPIGVFERIRALDPEIVEFNRSYRSAPAVLRAVNALAAEMGGTQLECAEPGRWPDDGSVISLERENTEEEAIAVMELLAETLRDPTVTVGIVARRGSRSQAIRDAADEAGIAYEDWSIPTHVPAIVDLLNRNLQEAVRHGVTDGEILVTLERSCRDLIEPADADTLDELARACEALGEMIGDGSDLRDAVASCRVTTHLSTAVSPGVHLLTGHKGKGQEFDWVFVLGLEEGHVPDFRSRTKDAVAEELKVLHVMVSRARRGVIFTHSRHTLTRSGWRAAEPSPWLGILRGVATDLDHK
ncbi:MAG: ATP-dependent helicase [Anaerolinea sp.]|nr:ATP-dependent helicase [Anaerolinea sp.]